MAEFVTQNLHAVDKITDSETLTSFRVFSRHDLDRMFSIGLEEGRGPAEEFNHVR